MKLETPRIYICYYPLLDQYFWRVSLTPKGPTRHQRDLWSKAHMFIARLNAKNPLREGKTI